MQPTSNEQATSIEQMPLTELEVRLIYSVIVAGKSAQFADAVMQRLQAELADYQTESLFQKLRWQMEKGLLLRLLERVRAGNYTKLSLCIRGLLAANVDLATCTPEDLERIHGIGPKTSRFFIIWTRPSERYAALDVHVLRWLRAQGHQCPTATPSRGTYAHWERIFLSEADKRGMTPRELDFEIWSKGSGYMEGGE
jgi:thermostable 8-oxoguanine DNA glycosylase